MQVSVKLYASLRENSNTREMRVECATLGEAVKGIRKSLKGEGIQVLLNGRNADSLPEKRKLKKSDLLEAFPPVGGG